jgi:hypothetical protein
VTIIEQKLIDAYTILTLAEKYITKEEDRQNENQKLVPEKFIQAVEIKVAERTIEVLGGIYDGI